MTTWPVNLISAFGRGESLALALQESGFEVHILDFTAALGGEWHKGPGPFPIAAQTFLPVQKQLLSEVKPLGRGLTFWLKDGPLELGGNLGTFFAEKSATVQNLKKDQRGADFEEDWLRRFMKTWASAFATESWSAGRINRSAFPYEDMIGLIPSAKEDFVMSFDRYQTLEYKLTKAERLQDIQFDGSRISELEVDVGRAVALTGEQWIWCLSSEETAKLGSEVANRLFSKTVRKPEWRWLSFTGHCDRGSWSAGFPEYTAVIDDLHLPWNYTNLILLRWNDPDVFRVWIKVPDGGYLKPEKRNEWAQEITLKLNARLKQAHWKIETTGWSVCPHSPVFGASDADESLPGWKNWDWVAPETTARLDLSSRLEREALAYHRMITWRNEQIKKQGAHRDNAVHAP